MGFFVSSLHFTSLQFSSVQFSSPSRSSLEIASLCGLAVHPSPSKLAHTTLLGRLYYTFTAPLCFGQHWTASIGCGHSDYDPHVARAAAAAASTATATALSQAAQSVWPAAFSLCAICGAAFQREIFNSSVSRSGVALGCPLAAERNASPSPSPSLPAPLG